MSSAAPLKFRPGATRGRAGEDHPYRPPILEAQGAAQACGPARGERRLAPRRGHPRSRRLGRAHGSPPSAGGSGGGGDGCRS